MCLSKSKVLFQKLQNNIFEYHRLIHTVRKFQNSYVTQILREINFGESGNSKTAFSAIVGVVKLIDSINFSLQKVLKFIKRKFLAFPHCVPAKVIFFV